MSGGESDSYFEEDREERLVKGLTDILGENKVNSYVALTRGCCALWLFVTKRVGLVQQTLLVVHQREMRMMYGISPLRC